MVNIGKLVQDLLLWSTREFGYLRLADAFVQSSSIMPQKRNPVALEHVRILASRALGEAQAVLTCAHNTPFGDVNDSEDDLQPLVFTMFADARRALRLLAGALGTAQVDRALMADRARRDFLTVTELADTLVRREGLSFREAHALVAKAVQACGTHDDAADHRRDAAAPGAVGPPRPRGDFESARSRELRSYPEGDRRTGARDRWGRAQSSARRAACHRGLGGGEDGDARRRARQTVPARQPVEPGRSRGAIRSSADELSRYWKCARKSITGGEIPVAPHAVGNIKTSTVNILSRFQARPLLLTLGSLAVFALVAWVWMAPAALAQKDLSGETRCG